MAALSGSRPSLENMAKEADRYWTGRLPGMAGKGKAQSFRGFYAVVYRNYSGFAHPTCRGLNPRSSLT